jgi:hypothetical protein
MIGDLGSSSALVVEENTLSIRFILLEDSAIIKL